LLFKFSYNIMQLYNDHSGHDSIVYAIVFVKRVDNAIYVGLAI
jgi:hypothetical protein